LGCMTSANPTTLESNKSHYLMLRCRANEVKE
jgi:hypothetical protein